jgi:hypothetical protein
MARPPTQQPAPRTGRGDPDLDHALFRNAGVANSYEVQFYRDQRWRIDSMFDDGVLAVHEAKRMSESGRYVSVRVIEESFDPVSGEARHATIYRGGRVAQANRKELEQSLKVRREIQAQDEVSDLKARQRHLRRAAAARKAGRRQAEPREVPLLAVAVAVIFALVAVGAVLLSR